MLGVGCHFDWREEFIMGFMQSYKRLDNLCRDMNGVGVTGYLEDMDRKSGAGLQVTGWWDDYRQLKYYRHIRNQIAHENNATEEGLCSEDDSAWIEAFHHRILDRMTLLPCTVRPGENSSPLRQGERQSLPSRRPQNRTKRNIEAAFSLTAALPWFGPQNRTKRNIEAERCF